MKNPSSTPMSDEQSGELDKILSAQPEEVSEYAKKCGGEDGQGHDPIHTWTGFWCENCEEQLSDLFPLSELLSEKRYEWLKAAIAQHTQEAVEAARMEAATAIQREFRYFIAGEQDNHDVQRVIERMVEGRYDYSKEEE